MTYLFSSNVEVSNDIGNPIPISKNTLTNSSTNPIYVSNEGSTVVVGNLPEVSVTAFEEPLAVGITPILQADAIYGLDPDFWNTSQLNGGTVVTTTNSTWQVSSGTNAGGYARLATNRYVTYQPGQGTMFRWTAAFTATGTDKDAIGITNAVQNTGPIDREDGYSIGYSGLTGTDPVTGADRRKIGILHRRSGRAETQVLTITQAPTGAQTATITLNSVVYTVSITAGSTQYTAARIAVVLKANTVANNTWDIESCGSTVTFVNFSAGARAGTYSFSSTGTGTLALGSFNQLVPGVSATDTWTYVEDWDNQTIQFDPTKLNVFGVDLRWLGAGRVRFFMEDPATGKIALIHTQLWSSQYLVPHIDKPSLRIVYRAGSITGTTPAQNAVITGASVFGAVQGVINQTGSSQGYYNIDSTVRAKDLVHHLISIQNPFVRNNTVNKTNLLVQDLTVAVQANDPSIIYIVKNAVGTSDLIVFNPVPIVDPFMFAQFSISAVTETLGLDRVSNVQTLGINSSAQFNLANYNLSLAPGEYVSVFIESSNAINRTSVGMTWRVV